MFDAKQSNCQIVDNLSNVDRSSGIDNIAQYPDLVKSVIEHGNNVKKKKKKEIVEPCVKYIEDEVTTIKEKTDNMLNDKDFKFNQKKHYQK